MRIPPLPASSPFRQVALTKGNLWLDKRRRLIQTPSSAYASFGCQRTRVPLPAEPPNAPQWLAPSRTVRTIKNPASSAGRVRPPGRTCSLLDRLSIRYS